MCTFNISKAQQFEQIKSSSWTDEYNLEWTTQSKNSSESMPCGGGDIGLNVWVENGELLFYIDRSGNIDENDQQLKSGRVRIIHCFAISLHATLMVNFQPALTADYLHLIRFL
jgi:hypothetical protein